MFNTTQPAYPTRWVVYPTSCKYLPIQHIIFLHIFYIENLTHLLRHRQEQYRVASQAQAHGGIDHMGAGRGLEPHGSLGHDHHPSNLTNQLFGEREQAPSRSHREEAGYSQQMRGDTGDPPPSSPSPYSDADHRNF